MAPPTAADLRRHVDWLRGTRGGQRLYVSKGASFKGARLTGGTFVRCDLRGAKFDEAKADGATFDRCQLDLALPGARVHQCAGLPDTGPVTAPRAQALWGWFRERLEVKPSAFEQDSPGLLDRDDEFFGFAVADAVLRDLVSSLRFKDLAAEVNRIATASPLVRDEAQRVEALKVARRLRALIEARAAREDSDEKHLYLADAAVFAVWAVESAPHLETTLAHAVRYLGALRPMDAAHGGYAVERLARAWFLRPKDGRIPWDERQFALNNAEPGTHVGLVEQTLCERATWEVVSSGPAEVVFRHHAGVELVVKVEKDHVVSREVVKDELK